MQKNKLSKIIALTTCLTSITLGAINASASGSSNLSEMSLTQLQDALNAAKQALKNNEKLRDKKSRHKNEYNIVHHKIVNHDLHKKICDIRKEISSRVTNSNNMPPKKVEKSLQNTNQKDMQLVVYNPRQNSSNSTETQKTYVLHSDVDEALKREGNKLMQSLSNEANYTNPKDMQLVVYKPIHNNSDKHESSHIPNTEQISRLENPEGNIYKGLVAKGVEFWNAKIAEQNKISERPEKVNHTRRPEEGKKVAELIKKLSPGDYDSSSNYSSDDGFSDYGSAPTSTESKNAITQLNDVAREASARTASRSNSEKSLFSTLLDSTDSESNPGASTPRDIATLAAQNTSNKQIASESLNFEAPNLPPIGKVQDIFSNSAEHAIPNFESKEIEKGFSLEQLRDPAYQAKLKSDMIKDLKTISRYSEGRFENSKGIVEFFVNDGASEEETKPHRETLALDEARVAANKELLSRLENPEGNIYKGLVAKGVEFRKNKIQEEADKIRNANQEEGESGSETDEIPPLKEPAGPAPKGKSSDSDDEHVKTCGVCYEDHKDKGKKKPGVKKTETPAATAPVGTAPVEASGGGAPSPSPSDLTMIAPNGPKSSLHSAAFHQAHSLKVNQAIVNIATDSVKDRLVASTPTAGVSAGDDDKPIVKGAWISGAFGSSNQGKTKFKGQNSFESKGFNGGAQGVTVGADFEINETKTIGAALTYAQGNVNSRDDKSAKSNLTNYAFSLYSQSNIAENLIWNNIASVSTGSVSKKRTIGDDKISGKAKTSAFSLETALGYTMSLSEVDNIFFTPNAGLRLSHNKIGGYKEKGSSNGENLVVEKASSNSVTAFFGANLSAKFKAGDDIEVRPSLNVSVEKQLFGKDSTVGAKFASNDMTNIKIQDKKSSKALGFNIAPSIAVQKDNMELSAGYNLFVQNKYQSHQGTLKLKISF
ncbi:MAG: autotransporter outer membrane beta-barrel domain-containing protein [Rickettsiaceae bacterium]|nr:autotransporter outer membrane beta-barrel domain-containing protein [Rickettsiaceae bacterium]